jgi:hypothetical protein
MDLSKSNWSSSHWESTRPTSRGIGTTACVISLAMMSRGRLLRWYLFRDGDSLALIGI